VLWIISKTNNVPSRATWPLYKQHWSPILQPSARHKPRLQYDGPVRRMVCLFTPPAYVGIILYCLVTEANVCEQLVRGHTRQCSS